MSRPERHYLPAWNAVKAKGEAQLKVPPHAVARVRKAVIKEKDKDIAYKLSLQEAGQKRKLLRTSYNSASWVLTLILTDCQSVTVDEL